MKRFPIFLLAMVLSPAAGLRLEAQDPAQLAADVQKLFAARCGACHKENGEEPESPYFADNLAALNDGEMINLGKPEESTVYLKVLNAKMPKVTKRETTEGKPKVPLTPDETQLVLEWIRAGAPAPAISATGSGGNVTPSARLISQVTPLRTRLDAPIPPVTFARPLGDASAPNSDPAPTPPQAPAPAKRNIVTEAQLLAGALQDLLSQPSEQRADIRYLTIHPQHNNLTQVTDDGIQLTRASIRKLLNSLSTNPKIAVFEKTGPEQVLHRIRLRDIGWTSAMWDRVTATYPYALDSDSLAAVAAPAHCPVPVVRADWFAAVTTRPPLYDTIMNHPHDVRELEARLGVRVDDNLAAGEAVRSGFTQSGVSRQNRLVERHEIRTYAGFYWKSYDFKENTGRSRLPDFPLGPPSARLLGGEHAFEHAGGEIIYSLPNGFQAYMLADGKDQKIDIGPIEVVSDREDTTHHAQIVNGFSCIACHKEGMRSLPPDQLRAFAGSGRFRPEEQRLIEKLHPEQGKIDALVKADAALFQKVLVAAEVNPKATLEPVLTLVDSFESDVTLAQAAAELGITVEELQKTLDNNAGSFFDTRAALRPPGTIPRVAFPEAFFPLAVRLGLGNPRGFDRAPRAFVAATDHAGVKADAADGRLAVELKANQSTYKKGDLMLFTVQTSEDAFVRLLYQDAHGNVKVLLPNAAHDGKIKGGVPVTFGDEKAVNPVTNKAFRIRCTPPFGSEMIAAVVSNTPFKDNDDVVKEANAKGGLADGKRRGKGAEVEIIEAVRARTQDARLGVARVFLTTTE